MAPSAAFTSAASIQLQALQFHPRNIRTKLGDLTELAASIRAEGVLVPLMAHRLTTGGLQLLHGHRRWAAADLAGLKRVPVVIVERQLHDDEAILLMLAEDKKRPVDDTDRAAAVTALANEFGWDRDAIAARLGVDRATLRGWAKEREKVQQRNRSPRKRRQTNPLVRATQLHAVLADWEGRAPAALLDQLRGLLGDWEPKAAPADSTIRAVS